MYKLINHFVQLQFDLTEVEEEEVPFHLDTLVTGSFMIIPILFRSLTKILPLDHHHLKNFFVEEDVEILEGGEGDFIKIITQNHIRTIATNHNSTAITMDKLFIGISHTCRS